MRSLSTQPRPKGLQPPTLSLNLSSNPFSGLGSLGGFSSVSVTCQTRCRILVGFWCADPMFPVKLDTYSTKKGAF